MRVVPVDRFVKYITPQAENCPEFVVRREVIATIADMCRETGCITAETCFTAKPDFMEHLIPMADGLNVELVRHAYCDGHELMSARLDELATAMRGTDWFEKGGAPLYYTFKRKNLLRLIPRPAEDAFVRCDVLVSIDRDAKQVPEQFFEDYLDTVVAGALSRIFRIAGQTYSNMQLAERNLMAYQQGLVAIKSEAMRDFTRAAGKVKFNRIV